MSREFFQKAFPPLVRVNYLTLMSLSAWLYLFDECSSDIVAVAAALTLGAIRSGIDAYHDSHRFDDEELPQLAGESLNVTALKGG